MTTNKLTRPTTRKRQRKIQWEDPILERAKKQVNISSSIYFYPNRPTLVPPDPANPLNPSPDYINGLEATGRYIAERKWNGDNVLINTSTLTFMNRQKEPLKRYIASPEILEELKRWPRNTVINAELLHFKTVNIKNTLIVHCIMVWEGKPLIGKTWGDSRKLLETCPAGKRVRISETFQSGFWDLFQQADGVEVEGIILKDPNGKIVFSTTPIKDVPWMLKIRKPCKKYSF